MVYRQRIDLEDRLNKCMPVASDVQLGSLLSDLINAVNALEADNAALLAALTTANVSGLTVPVATAEPVVTLAERG